MRLAAGTVILALSLLAALLAAAGFTGGAGLFGIRSDLGVPVLVALWVLLTGLGFAVLWPRRR